MQGSNNREWLIKSSGEIKGPYTFDEIAQGIASKEFILVDEISRSFCRWKYLRDEEVFDKVIAEVKNLEYLKNEKTFTNSETDTLTNDLSNQMMHFGGENLLSNVNEHLKEHEEARAAHQKAKEEAARKEKEEQLQVKSFAMEADLKKQTQAKSSFYRWFMAFVVIIAGAGYYYMSKKDKILSYDDLKKKAYENINYGNFEDAKFYLDKAIIVNNTNEELKYLLSYVSVELEDNITAQRLINDLSKSATDKNLKSKAFNLAGILQLKNFNLGEAKNNFEEALKQNPKFAAAYFNLGVALYLENKFDLAYLNFSQSLVSGGMDGSILLSMVEMTARHGQELRASHDKKRQSDEVLQLINRQVQSLHAFRQELKIAAAYLYFLQGEKQAMEKAVEDALNVDPSLTSDHVQDVAFYKGLVTWDRMGLWVKKMKDAEPSNENLKTLYGYTLFRGSDKLKGKDLIEGLLKSDYSNTSNQIILSYILMTLKRDDDAKATLAPIMHHKNKSLAFLLMGRICLLKKDFPCADLNFSEALRINNENLPATTGLARTYFELKDLKRSKDLMTKAYSLSPTYKPLLNLKREIEEQNK